MTGLSNKVTNAVDENSFNSHSTNVGTPEYSIMDSSILFPHYFLFPLLSSHRKF